MILKTTKAFTLPEMILAIVIVAMLMTAVAVAMKSSLDVYYGNEKFTRAQQAAETAMMKLSRHIRTATTVEKTTVTETVNISDDESYEASVTKLTLTSPQDDNDYAQVQYVYLPATESYHGRLFLWYQEEGSTLTKPTEAIIGEEDGVEVTALDLTVTNSAGDGGRTITSVRVQLQITVDGEVFNYGRTITQRTSRL